MVIHISEIPDEVGKLGNLYNFYINDNEVSGETTSWLLENSTPTM
jgi:Leucine-rich repeat (LRR) protein